MDYSENNRKKQHNDLECVQIGFANGVAPGFPLTESEKWKMVDEAADATTTWGQTEWAYVSPNSYSAGVSALRIDMREFPAGTTPNQVKSIQLFAENNGDFDKTWKAVTSPFMKHVNQVQIYMKLAELLDLEYKPQEAVLVYESKSNQEAKEFVVPKSDFGISHLFEAAQMIADAVANKTPPVCNIGTTGCKRCGGYTDESN